MERMKFQTLALDLGNASEGKWETRRLCLMINTQVFNPLIASE
jgi:hypothetical protein